MITIIILVLINLISTYGAWKLTQIAHSKGGIWEDLTPNIGDVLMVILPVFSTACFLFLWVSASKEYRDLSKFFKVKK